MAPIHVEATPVEIHASPNHVRETLLDFENMPQWHNGHFVSIAVPSGKKGVDLVPGDKLKVALKSGMSFSPVIQENTPSKFAWRGSLPGIFTGDHVFEFLPSETTAGSTKFVQYENFSGLLSFTMNPQKKSGASNLEGFNAVNLDLKARAEESQQAAQ